MDFFDNLKNAVDSRDFEFFKILLYNEQNVSCINEFAWDIASLFCDFLTADTNNNEASEHFEQIHEASLYLCKQFGNPKEITLVFQEAAGSLLTNDRNFKYFIDVTLALFNRLTLKFISYSFEHALNLLNIYLQNVFRLNSEQRINNLLCKLIYFIENSCALEANCETSLLSKDSLKSLSSHLLVNYFFEPFFVNELIEHYEQSFLFDSLKQTFRLFIELNRDFLKAIYNIEFDLERQEKIKRNKKVDQEDESDEEHASDNLISNKILINKYSTGSLIYFAMKTFSKPSFNTTIPIIPLVYEKSYVLLTFLTPVLRLLEKFNNNDLLQTRCFDTLTFLITILDFKSITEIFLETGTVFDALLMLFKIAIYNVKEAIRRTAITLIKTIFAKLNRKARFTFIKLFWKQSDLDDTMRIYLRSFLVYLFKEEINECFNENDQFYFTDSFRTTSHFDEFARMVINLTNKVETDLVHESSQVVATLNLIRFIILKDNRNRISFHKSSLTDEYLKHLEKAIKISKAHYELERKNTLENKVSQSKNDRSLNYSVKTLTNEEVTEPTSDDKLIAIQSAIHQLDIIECLRIRVNEIIAEKKLMLSE